MAAGAGVYVYRRILHPESLSLSLVFFSQRKDATNEAKLSGSWRLSQAVTTKARKYRKRIEIDGHFVGNSSVPSEILH